MSRGHDFLGYDYTIELGGIRTTVELYTAFVAFDYTIELGGIRTTMP